MFFFAPVMHDQIDLPFDDTSRPDGLNVWRQEREAARLELCRKSGMPVGHPVEVTLAQGVVLRGPLKLTSRELPKEAGRQALEFEVEQVTFRLGEIRQVLRTD